MLAGMLIRVSANASGYEHGSMTYVIFFVLPSLVANHTGGPKISVVCPTVLLRTATLVNIFMLHNYTTEGLPLLLLGCGHGSIFHAYLTMGVMNSVYDAARQWRLPNIVFGTVLAIATHVRGLIAKFPVTGFLSVFLLASHVVGLSLLTFLLVSPFTMLSVFHNIFFV